MSTFIQFINRKKELGFLENQLKKPWSFVVLYGRRRVGKSELIKHFMKNKKGIYLLATQEVERGIVQSFSDEIAEHFDDATLKINGFSEFSKLMEYLGERELNKLVLVIDEFPYLVDANKAIPSIIQKYWDLHFKSKGLHLVLCGSSIGAMETEVLGRKSPLYGRRTGQWKLDPMPFENFAEFFPNAGFERLVEFYSITGGIPLYILEFNGGKTAYENAKSAIATRGAILYQEAEFILKEELREPKTYFSILKGISAGKNTLNELSNALGAERTALVRYLDTLAGLNLIEISKPVVADEKSRKGAYAIKDNYFKFWFRFIYPFRKDLDSFDFTGFEKNFRQNFNSHVGRQFEQVCRESILRGMPQNWPKVGGWWGAYRENNERKTAEIDIVAIDEASGRILFGECKWKGDVNAGEVLRELRKKAALVQWKNSRRKEHYVIFAKSFREKKHYENVFLFDLRDLERIFRKQK